MKKALLVIDMQNVCVGEKHATYFKYDNENLIQAVNKVIDENKDNPVIYIKNIMKKNLINKINEECNSNISNDDTEITHSEMKPDGRVKVYIETPDIQDGFHNAVCYLPDYTWQDINGYSETEMAYFKQLVRENAHLIMEFSREGGVLNAANL